MEIAQHGAIAMKGPWHHSRPRAAVFSVSPFPSPQAHVGAIIGMTNALQLRGYATTLYAFFRTDAHETLVKQFGLLTSVGFGWSAKRPTRVGMLLSLISWILVAAVRSHDVILTRSPLIALAARRCDRVLLEIHQEPVNRLSRAKLDHWILPLLQGRRYQFVFISRTLRNHYLKEFPGLSRATCSVAPSGFHKEWFPNFWSPSAGKGRLTYAGSLYEGRGIELIIELARRMPHGEFHIIGGTRAEWSALTSRLPVPVNCHHIPHLPPVAIAAHLIQSDVLLAPYQQRVLISSGSDISRVISPLKIAEYMAAGRPIIASDLPSIREFVEGSRAAVLVAPEDIEAWVRAAQDILDAPHRRSVLGRAAFDYANDRLDWESRLAKILPGSNESGGDGAL